MTPSTIGRIIESYRPDFIHINTEGPLGACRRHRLQRRGRGSRRAFARNSPNICLRECRSAVVDLSVAAAVPQCRAGCMVPTASLRDDLAARGFRDLRHWARGVDHQLFRPRAGADLGLPRPIFLSVGRVAIEKNLEAFLDLDLPGSKVVVGDGPARAALSRAYPQVHFLGRLSDRAVGSSLCSRGRLRVPEPHRHIRQRYLGGLGLGVAGRCLPRYWTEGYRDRPGRRGVGCRP